MEVYELCDTDKKELVIGKIVKDAIMQCEDAPHEIAPTSSKELQLELNWIKWD
jgi:hypothetical protein